MSSFNKVILMGGITRDLELRETPSGAKVCNLPLAISESWRDKQGNQQESTCYIDAVVWNKTAENCVQYLTKGRQVLVEGRLDLQTWENESGEKRSKHVVRADHVTFLNSGKRDESPAPSKVETDPASVTADDVAGLGDSDDLPF